MRTIGFEGMKFHAAVGVFPEEKILGNEIEIDLRIEIPDHDANDNLKDTVDYSRVYEVVAAIMKEEHNLLETVAGKIVAALSQNFPSVQKLFVRVAKLHPPLQGQVERVFIEKEWVRS